MCDGHRDCGISWDDEHVNMCQFSQCPVNCRCWSGILSCVNVEKLPQHMNRIYGLSLKRSNINWENMYTIEGSYLIHLNVSENQISSLQLTNAEVDLNWPLLQVIDVSNNLLTHLNKGAFRFPRLKRLYATNNAIISIENNFIHQNHQLWILDIRFNKIQPRREFHLDVHINLILSDLSKECCHPFGLSQCPGIKCSKFITTISTECNIIIMSVISLVISTLALTLLSSQSYKLCISERDNSRWRITCFVTNLVFTYEFQKWFAISLTLVYLVGVKCADISIGVTFLAYAGVWYTSLMCHVIGVSSLVAYFLPLYTDLIHNILAIYRLHRMRNKLAHSLNKLRVNVELVLVWTLTVVSVIGIGKATQSNDNYCMILHPLSATGNPGIAEIIVFLLITPFAVILFVTKCILLLVVIKTSMKGASRFQYTRVEVDMFKRLVLLIPGEVILRLLLTVICVVGFTTAAPFIGREWVTFLVIPLQHAVNTLSSIAYLVTHDGNNEAKV